MNMPPQMSMSPEAMEKATQNMMQAYEEMNTLAREYMDAASKSAAAAMSGFEVMSKNMNGLMQETMARTMSASKMLMGAKSVQELTSTHSEFMKDSFDHWMSQTGKLSEVSARIAKETMDPLAQHANNAMSRAMSKAKAAA